MFDPEILEAIRRDAMERLPHESCGLVVAGEGYVPMPNIHPEPDRFFEMPVEAAERIAAGGVLAVVHSHTETGLDHPSAEDQRRQMDGDLPWGLVVCRDGVPGQPFFWGEGLIPDVPVMPRDWRWGPTGTDGRGDCLALVRDWYRTNRGILIPYPPHDETWQEADPEAYENGWMAAGFSPVNERVLEAGDLIMFAVRSRGRPNHAAIYLGSGYILHHTQGGLARREAIGDWQRVACRWLRPPLTEATA